MRQDQLTQDLIYHSVYRIETDTALSPMEKVKPCFHVFNLMLEEATKAEPISFTTLFSRIAYVANLYHIEGALIYYLHRLRRAFEKETIVEENVKAYLKLAYYTINAATAAIWEPDQEKEFHLSDDVRSIFRQKDRQVVKYKPFIEALVTAVDVDAMSIDFIDEEDGTDMLRAQFDVTDRNEIFTRNIQALGKFFQLPVHVNLIDVEILKDGVHLPKALVIRPDYLVSVTSIAEAFKYYGSEPLLYVLNKFRLKESSPALMVGNIVNHFLDVLISEPNIEFEALKPKLFQLAPIAFTMLEDQTVVDMVRTIEIHFDHLKKVVNEDFERLKIQREKSYLEPSFLSRLYGIQGRLDLLHMDDENEAYDIVELKSGKPFRTNTYGLNNNHYVQTLLYDLLIASAFGRKTNPKCYILYSSLEEDQMRFAPPVKAQQYEAMRIRNDFITLEQNMTRAALPESNLLSYLRAEHFPKAKGFDIKNIDEWELTFKSLTKAEKSYLKNYVAFIAREQSLSKTGQHGLYKSNGHAALWLENNEEKEDRFALLAYLQLEENKAEDNNPILILRRTKRTSPLANFRVGDIGVLYPNDGASRSVLRHQVFKCTILEIAEDRVEVRLRSQQYNHEIFRQHAFWNIEEDSMDSSYNTMYRSLYQWCRSAQQYRRRILGVESPRALPEITPISIDNLTAEQNQVLNEMLHTQDYYLLWGPPGTGKTSVMLRELIHQLHDRQNENILVLAYTNRAVDEICAAIKSISDDPDYFIRIGSRYSCHESYRSYLLDRKIEGMSRRSQIADMLQKNRLYVSTVSSIVNKTELLHLKQFDTIIIDEASQIIEPMIIGLLERAKRFILIGDHQQLPAVVVQDQRETHVQDESLIDLGITDLRMSLFERLYLRCTAQNWDHAIGILSQQGRMHESLMQFPNEHFYQGQLSALDKIDRLRIKDKFLPDATTLYLSDRKIYVDTPVDSYYSWKTNQHEADLVVKIILELLQALEESGLALTPSSIGVITPYRAQIAKIKQAMSEMDSSVRDMVTVDTVERYQGGARDIIILSMCTNKLSQMDALVSLSASGVDRKLNVALTRAREQLIVLGNKEILATNETYQSLVESCTEVVV